MNSIRQKHIVATTGIHNFRDFGSYPVAGGGRMVKGKLYRSAQHVRATDCDLLRLDAIQFEAIVDLRGASERRKAPCRRALGFAGIVHATGMETSGHAPHVEALARLGDAASVRREMVERYATMPFRPHLVEIYRTYFEVLSEVTGPVLVYCAAGKDRTGLLVALLQTLLGVHADDVMAEYLLTNESDDSGARIEALRTGLRRQFGSALSEDAIRVVAGVEADFLKAAMDSICARHGCVHTYLRDVLGMTPSRAEHLTGKLIV